MRQLPRKPRRVVVGFSLSEDVVRRVERLRAGQGYTRSAAFEAVLLAGLEAIGAA